MYFIILDDSKYFHKILELFNLNSFDGKPPQLFVGIDDFKQFKAIY
jgi:hypothetical protein